MPDNLFDPAHFSDVRKPLGAARSLPGFCYTSDAFFAREIDTLFKPGWMFVCREEQIGAPGDYLAVDIVAEPLILVRGHDNRVRAFANYCTHRGARLADGAGNTKVFNCPLHNWVFDLTGDLRGAKDMNDNVNFDRADLRLPRYRLESWAGFIFVNLTGDGPPLLDYLGDLAGVLDAYRPAEMQCVRKTEYTVESNWKLYVEVDMETYHTPFVHPSSIGNQPVTPQLGQGNFHGVHLPWSHTIAVKPAYGGPRFDPIPGLPADAGSRFTIIHPSFFLVNTVDAMWWINKRPLSANRTFVDVGFCFPRQTVERPDFADIAPAYFERWDEVVEEDNDITERQQSAMSSPRYRPGPFAPREAVVHSLDNWILDSLLNDTPNIRPIRLEQTAKTV